MIPVVGERALRDAMPAGRAVDVIRDAFHADGEGRALVPSVINLEIPGARGEFHVKGFVVTPAAAVEEVCGVADVLITATPSRQPLVRAEWLRPGMHVTAVGSDSPGKQELAAECLQRADILVVDRYAQCAAFGELKHALDARLLASDEVHADRGAVVARRRPGRISPTAITIADLTGVGFQDTAIASDAFQRASAR